MLGLPALLLFLSLALAGYALSLRVRAREDRRQVLDRRLVAITGGPVDPHPSPLLKDRRLSRIALMNALLVRTPAVTPLVRMIRQAGLKKRVGEVLLYVPLLASLGFLLSVTLGGGTLPSLGAALAGGSIPLALVQRMRRRRTLLFGDQLPDALDLIRAALQAGHGFLSALTVVADEFPDPIAQEFREVAEEIRLGLPIRDALHHLIERVDDPNLPILVVGLLVALDAGGNLAEVLDNISYTIRERFKLLRETRVLTAQGRLSGSVLTALPFLVGILMYLLNRTYFNPLLESPKGHAMIAYSIVSVLIGNACIRRLVHIRV